MIYKVVLSALVAIAVGVPFDCAAAEAYANNVNQADTKIALGFKLNPGMINDAIKILQPAVNKAGKNKPNNNTPGNIGGAFNATQFRKEVLRLVNVERAKQGLNPLVTNDDIERSAMVRAKELVIKYSHTRPDGSRGISALSDWGRCAAENIAKGQKTPADVMRVWMNSEGHRANILYPDMTELGVGYVYDTSNQYKHHWVQLFRG